MNTPKLAKIYFALLLIAAAVMFNLWYFGKSYRKYTPRDFADIKHEGILRVVTEYNEIGYYVSGDSMKGLQYELCKAIGNQSGLEVQIFIENDLENSIKGLLEQQYDIIARNIPVTTANKDNLSFSDPITLSKHVLVQRVKNDSSDVPFIRNQIELAKKTLYIAKNSPNILRLKNLSEEIADTIYIKEDEHYKDEQLLYMVANGDIDYAVVDQQIAFNNKKRFPQIDCGTDITFTQ